MSTPICGTKGLLMMGGLVLALGVSVAQAASWGGTRYVGSNYENVNMSFKGGTGTLYGKPNYAQTFSSNSWSRVHAGCDTGNVGYIQKGPNEWAQGICANRSNGTRGSLITGTGQLYR
jgi:hypothetical protein